MYIIRCGDDKHIAIRCVIYSGLNSHIFFRITMGLIFICELIHIIQKDDRRRMIFRLCE